MPHHNIEVDLPPIVGRIDHQEDFKYSHEHPIKFVKYVGRGIIFACDDRGNLLILRASNLKRIRILPYGKLLRDCVGTTRFVYCAFDLKLVVFDRSNWQIETKWDTFS